MGLTLNFFGIGQVFCDIPLQEHAELSREERLRDEDHRGEGAGEEGLGEGGRQLRRLQEAALQQD